MTDKDRRTPDPSSQGNAPSWVDEVLSSSATSPSATSPSVTSRSTVPQPSPAAGWDDWPGGRSSEQDPARDLRLPEDPPRPAPPAFDSDDWVSRVTGGQVRDPQLRQPSAAPPPPRTDPWAEPVTPVNMPLPPQPTAAQPLTTPPMVSSDVSQKKLVAGLLAILLGSFGVHKFYLGMNTSGLLMLGANVGSWILAFLLSLVTLFIGSVIFFPLAGMISSALAVVGLIEGIIYLTKSDAEFQHEYLNNKKNWF